MSLHQTGTVTGAQWDWPVPGAAPGGSPLMGSPNTPSMHGGMMSPMMMSGQSWTQMSPGSGGPTYPSGPHMPFGAGPITPYGPQMSPGGGGVKFLDFKPRF